jgi:hypothetical protein
MVIGNGKLVLINQFITVKNIQLLCKIKETNFSLCEIIVTLSNFSIRTLDKFRRNHVVK